MATFQKRGTTWRVLIRKGQYRDDPLTATFDTKREAETWALKIESDIASKKHQIATKRTVREAIIKYRDEVAVNHKGSETDIGRLNAFLKALKFLNKPLGDVDHADIIEWRDARLNTMRLKNKTEQLYVKISPATVRREFNLLSSVFTIARREWRWIQSNPTEDVSRPQDSKPRSRRVGDDELSRLADHLGYLDDEPIETQKQQAMAIMLLGVETTMRRGELFKLLRSNVSFEHRVAMLPDTKNGLDRFVPLSPVAIDILQRIKPFGDDQFFSIKDPKYITDTIRKACQKLGIENLKMHDSRHEGATRLAKIFQNPADLAKITGHKDLNTLMNVYYNPDVREMADKIHEAKTKK